MRCDYCRSMSPDDARGNCGACGAPRPDIRATEPVYYMDGGITFRQLADDVFGMVRPKSPSKLLGEIGQTFLDEVEKIDWPGPTTPGWIEK